MAVCLSMSTTFKMFDVSDMYSIEEKDHEILMSHGHRIDTFVLQGNDTWLLTVSKNFNDFMQPLTNLTALVLSCTCIPLSLDFLKLMPRTLVKLHLDNLGFPAKEFIQYLRPLCNQLDDLAITSSSHLSCFDLVTILQHFWKLDKLDITHTDYLRPGTVGTILRYCYNLQVFYFSTILKCTDSRAWVDLVECDYDYVTFHKQFYDNITTCKMYIDMGIDEPSYDSE